MELKTKLPKKKNTEEFINNGVFKKKLNGYIFIRIGTQFIAEHRLVVEEYLGRSLTNTETVHHEDFNPTNNNITNLVLFPTKKAHSHFHRQVLQFGYTNPRFLEILRLKSSMLLEHNKLNEA